MLLLGIFVFILFDLKQGRVHALNVVRHRILTAAAFSEA
jgi:hypothetical protein